MNVASMFFFIAVFFILMLLSIGSFAVAVAEHKRRKETEKQKDIINEAYSGFCEVVNDIERIETGNNTADFDSSIELLHDISKGKNKK